MRRADRNAWVAYLSAAKVRPGSCASFYCFFLSMPSHACFQINRHCIVISELALCVSSLLLPLSLGALPGSVGGRDSRGGAGAHVFCGGICQV